MADEETKTGDEGVTYILFDKRTAEQRAKTAKRREVYLGDTSRNIANGFVSASISRSRSAEEADRRAMRIRPPIHSRLAAAVGDHTRTRTISSSVSTSSPSPPMSFGTFAKGVFASNDTDADGGGEPFSSSSATQALSQLSTTRMSRSKSMPGPFAKNKNSSVSTSMPSLNTIQKWFAQRRGSVVGPSRLPVSRLEASATLPQTVVEEESGTTFDDEQLSSTSSPCVPPDLSETSFYENRGPSGEISRARLNGTSRSFLVYSSALGIRQGSLNDADITALVRELDSDSDDDDGEDVLADATITNAISRGITPTRSESNEGTASSTPTTPKKKKKNKNKKKKKKKGGNPAAVPDDEADIEDAENSTTAAVDHENQIGTIHIAAEQATEDVKAVKSGISLTPSGDKPIASAERVPTHPNVSKLPSTTTVFPPPDNALLNAAPMLSRGVCVSQKGSSKPIPNSDGAHNPDTQSTAVPIPAEILSPEVQGLIAANLATSSILTSTSPAVEVEIAKTDTPSSTAAHPGLLLDMGALCVPRSSGSSTASSSPPRTPSPLHTPTAISSHILKVAMGPPSLPLVTPTTSSTPHPLQNSWTVHFDSKATAQVAKLKSVTSASHPSSGANAYEAALQTIGTLHTVEDFCKLFNWMKKPSQMQINDNLHVFREGVRPMWEDPANKDGGNWTLALDISKRDEVDQWWLQLCLALIGNHFDGGLDDSICGIILSLRAKIFRMQVWLRKKDDTDTVNNVGRRICTLLDLVSPSLLETYRNSREPLVCNKVISLDFTPHSAQQSSRTAAARAKTAFFSLTGQLMPSAVFAFGGVGVPRMHAPSEQMPSGRTFGGMPVGMSRAISSPAISSALATSSIGRRRTPSEKGTTWNERLGRSPSKLTPGAA